MHGIATDARFDDRRDGVVGSFTTPMHHAARDGHGHLRGTEASGDRGTTHVRPPNAMGGIVGAGPTATARPPLAGRVCSAAATTRVTKSLSG